MAEVSPQLDPIYLDATELEKKLLVVASRQFASAGCVGIDVMLPGTGKTALGLAHDAIVKLLKSGKWRPGENGREIYPYAVATVKSLFIDLLRDAAGKNTTVMDPDELETLRASNELSVEIQLIRAERFEQIKLRMGNDTDGKGYLDAVRDGARTRTEIAEAMGKSPQEVTKIQRRVQYKLKEMEGILDD